MVGVVEQKLKSNETETSITKDMIKLCGDLPFFQQECATIVVNYLPSIIELVVTEEDPETVCTQVGLCVSEKPAIHPVPEKHPAIDRHNEGAPRLPRLTKPLRANIN